MRKLLFFVLIATGFVACTQEKNPQVIKDEFESFIADRVNEDIDFSDVNFYWTVTDLVNETYLEEKLDRFIDSISTEKTALLGWYIDEFIVENKVREVDKGDLLFIARYVVERKVLEIGLGQVERIRNDSQKLKVIVNDIKEV